MVTEPTQPNPNWRTPDDGELCGGGYDHQHGWFKMFCDARNNAMRYEYEDGYVKLFVFSPDPGDNRTNWNGKLYIR